jgi:thiol-disulfide isomerase/thioredoxin
MKNRVIATILLIIIIPAYAFSAGYMDNPEKGWNWYKDPKLEKPAEKKPEPPKEEKKEEEAKEEPKKEPEELKNTSVDNFEFPLTDEAKSVPVLAEWLRNPTEENARKWMAWQAKYFKHNEQISRSLRNAYLNHGDEDYRLEGMPEQPMGSVVASRAVKAKMESIFNKASDKVAIFYFYKDGCDQCEAQISPLQIFADRYDFLVKAIAPSPELEKKGLPFDSKAIPTMFQKFNIQSVPAIAAYNNDTKNVQVIAKGYTPTSQIELNLKAFLLKEKIISEDEFLHMWRTEDSEILQAIMEQAPDTSISGGLVDYE